MSSPQSKTFITGGYAAIIADGQRHIHRAGGPGQIGPLGRRRKGVTLRSRRHNPDLQINAIDRPHEMERPISAPLKGPSWDGRRESANREGHRLVRGIDPVTLVPKLGLRHKLKSVG